MLPKNAVHILLVEDDDIDAEAVLRFLGKSAMHFVFVRETCLNDALIASEKNSFSVVLLDLGLPDSKGLDGVKKLRAKAPHLPIVVLTGLDDQERASQAMRAGTQDYLVKGKFDQEGLERSIRYAIERQSVQVELTLSMQALKVSQSRFRRLYEAMFEGMIIHDGEKVIDTNEQFASMFGYTITTIEGVPILDLIDKNSRDIVQEHVACHSEEMYEVLGRRQNGDVFPIEIAARNMVHNGQHLRVAVVRDMTEKRASLAQIRTLSRAVEQSANMVIVTNAQGFIEYINPQFTQVTGYTLDDVRGKNPSLFRSEFTPNETYSELWKTILAGDIWVGELYNKTRDGKYFWVSSSIAPVRDEADQITHFVAIQEDITHKKKIQAELEALNTTLEERVVARTQELGEINQELEKFAYSVSHDLQAPLRSIDGFSAILIEDYSDCLGEKGKDYLQRVRGGASRMKRLIGDMLRFSRQIRGELVKGPVDLTLLAKEIVEDLQLESLGRQVCFEVEEGLMVKADKGMMRVVLENLLGNAWKFTQGVSLTHIVMGKEKEYPYRFYVQDNGAGFDMAQASHIFEPFRRLHTEEEFPGSGIGLATVRRIIHRHGGRVMATGKIGEGATLYFSL